VNYQYALTIPANTEEGDPLIVEDELPFGVISQVSLSWTPGDYRLTRVAIFHAEQKILPSNPDEWFRGWAETYTFPENYKLSSSWNRIVIKGWSKDNIYEHEVLVRISVLGPLEKLFRAVFEWLFSRLPVIGGE
jgi:hypothetical protein